MSEEIIMTNTEFEARSAAFTDKDLEMFCEGLFLHSTLRIGLKARSVEALALAKESEPFRVRIDEALNRLSSPDEDDIQIMTKEQAARVQALYRDPVPGNIEVNA